MKILKNILGLFGLITIGLLSNCKECPPSEKIGEVYLQDSSLLFHPYQGDETLTFVNGEGDKKIFTARDGVNNDDSTKIVVEEICDTGTGGTLGVFGLNSVIFYSSEQHSINFEFESDNFSYRLFTSALSQSRDTVLYDEFSLTGYISSNDVRSINIITSERGNSPDEHRENLYESYNYVSDTMLLDQRFENVYYSTEDGTAFLFALNVGVVGINDGNDLWILEN